MLKDSESLLRGDSAAYLESLYQHYLANTLPSVEWVSYFSHLSLHDEADALCTASSAQTASATPGTEKMPNGKIVNIHDTNEKQVAVLQLINAYRFRGHRRADLDPLTQYPRPEVPELDPEFYELCPEDFESVFQTGSLVGEKQLKFAEILDVVRSTYCHHIGFEYMHINSTEEKRWIQEKVESCRAVSKLTPESKLLILDRLIAAQGIEEYLHNKYVGQKRFSLEGGESLIPLLYRLVRQGAETATREIVIGMTHRGRLNVLVNVIGKEPHELFSEFEGGKADDTDSDDVKYHLGYSSDRRIGDNSVHLTLLFNPSHLEVIDPVVEGSVRARQDRRHDKKHSQVLPVIIHGDAAFAGQGIVMETFNLSQIRGYSTGGTVHVVINNQIGFTTSDPLDSRSTLYCTDVAKMVQAPIFHVNGDDPEAVSLVAGLALDYRMRFQKDVVIDLVCYRRHGHSEADEPAATQPVMYQHIKQQQPVCTLYAERLIADGLISREAFTKKQKNYVASLEANRSAAEAIPGEPEAIPGEPDKRYALNYDRYRGVSWRTSVETRISQADLQRFTEAVTKTPAGFVLHSSVDRIIRARKQMGAGEVSVDWGYAETIAYASLLDTGYAVRLSGQDSARGTFFHRHASLHDQNTGKIYLPLQHIKPDQPQFLVLNSPLSEMAVLGYEYGYSISAPNVLVIWEAQFGDFSNNAQVIFDQFLSSCATKWGRYCGLVVMLPHGYDGQGPEHSSARLERVLQLCAEENMQVCVPSTAGQMFHLLRRQMLRHYRRPLIIISPKSLLRHKLAASPVSVLLTGSYELVIDEIDALDANEVTQLILCTGKVYYDLLTARREHDIQNIALVRIEQLYPFPADEVVQTLKRYPHLEEILWVQEEPKNQGAWRHIRSINKLPHCLALIARRIPLRYVGRPASASPATGSVHRHKEQQATIVREALDLDLGEKTPVATRNQREAK